VLVYNLARLALLGLCLLVGWYAGLRGLPWIAIGFLASGVLSWFLLARQRVGMGLAIERAVERGRSKLAERTAAEDAYADSLHADADGSAARAADPID
jgi:hypothetical protein